MIRFYLTPIVGSGTETDPYRAKAEGFAHVCLVPTNPETGIPLFNWGLMVVRGDDLTTLDADSELEGFPINLNSTIGDLSTAARNRIRNKLQTLGFDTTQFTNATTIRAVLTVVGERLFPGFDISKLNAQ